MLSLINTFTKFINRAVSWGFGRIFAGILHHRKRLVLWKSCVIRTKELRHSGIIDVPWKDLARQFLIRTKHVSLTAHLWLLWLLPPKRWRMFDFKGRLSFRRHSHTRGWEPERERTKPIFWFTTRTENSKKYVLHLHFREIAYII